MKKSLYILTILACSTPQTYTQLVVGDPNAATNTTFSFDVGFVAYDDKSELSPARWWSATNDATIATFPDATKQYGLAYTVQTASYINPDTTIQATPMATSGDATLFAWDGTNVIPSQGPNPIWNGQFTNFDVSNHKPLFTVASAPNILYSVQEIKLFATETETDVNSTSLLIHDFGAGQQVKTIRGLLDTLYAIYANGAFGSAASNQMTIFNRTVGPSANTTVGQPYLSPLATQDITVNTNALKGGSAQPAVASFGPYVTIRLAFFTAYVGIQATAAIGGVANGILLPQLTASGSTYTLNFEQLAQTPVITGGFDTIVSAESGHTIRITDLAGMLTSTNLQYMIVARDTGTGPQTIYAMPIVSTGTYIGAIADYTSISTVFGTKPPIFASRNFDTIISDGNQISLSNPSVATQITVGGGALPLDSGSNVQRLFVVGDSVYAVLGGIYSSTQQPGTFRSQAIFAADGHIIAWTPWARVLGSDSQMNYAFIDSQTLTGFYVAAETPSATPSYNSLFETTFTTNSNLAPFLTDLPFSQGGTQGIFNFGQTTSGFNNAISLLIATSLNRIVIGQTGYNNGTTFVIKPMNSSDVISFSGTAINDQQAIVAAEIAHNGINHWIFAAGISGVSVLTDNTTGYTWHNNLANVAALNAGQTWKTVGNFSNVKKLVWDSTNIYILTNTNIYSIALDPAKFTATPTTPLNAEIILAASTIGANVSLLDLIVDNGYCLVGTTNGLYELNNGNLQQIVIPQGLPAISKLIAISTNQTPQHNFKTLSNLLVLNNSFGTQQARLHRFLIQNGAISQLPDTFAAQQGSTTQGIPAPFIIFDSYISNYFTDGSWNVANSYYLGPNQPQGSAATPFLQQIMSGVRSGLSSSQVIMKMYATYAPLPFISTGSNNLGLLRETTSGAIISAGEFEAYTNA